MMRKIYIHLLKTIFNKTLFILFFAGIMLNIHASTNVVKYISNVNGLSNNSINCIYEDSDHLLWIGTWDGLNSYNGREIKTYRYKGSDSNSISNNIIRQIIEQDNSDLWIATDYGVNRWNKASARFERYYIGTEDESPKQEKSFIIGKTSGNTVICFVKEQGFYYFDEYNNRFEKINISSVDYIKDFIIDNRDNIIILYQNGDLAYFSLKSGYNTGESIVINDIKLSFNVDRLFASGDYLLLVSGRTIHLMDENTFSTVKSIQLDINKPVSQVLYSGQILYISFIEGGCIAYHMTDNSYTRIEEIPQHTSIFTMFRGSQDILWLGSDGQGVLQMYEYNFPFKTVHTNFPVRSICNYDEHTMLVGSKGGGVKKFDIENGSISDYLSVQNGLISNSVYAMAKNRKGDIFIGTEGEGINILDHKTNRISKMEIPDRFPYFKAVYNLHFTNNDSLLWVGTSGYGLLKLVIEKVNDTYGIKNAEQYISSDRIKSLKNDIVYAITSDSDKILWFGTRGGGLYKIEITKNIVERVDDVDNGVSLSNNDILCLSHFDEELWVGTSYGLNKLKIQNNSIQIEQFLDNNGLNNNTIHGVLKDDAGNIWVSTNAGISLIEPNGKIENFTFKDGLQNDEFSDGGYFRDAENNLYFGGVSGFNYFNPQKIQLRDFKAPLVLNKLKIYNHDQDQNERIADNTLKLSYDERYVSFSFLVRDFINNENCEYSYRLLKYSDEWKNLGNNPNIEFTKLPPGDYLLEVKASNGDKIWNDQIYRLHVIVGYPWWFSMPAILIYIALLLIVAYIVQATIKNRIRLSRQILIEQIELQHQQKMHESKLNFFTNVAHEFFTPLTLIYSPAQHLLEKADLDGYTKHYLQVIKNNAERMQRLISELLEFRKAKSGYRPLHPEEIDIKLLTEYVSDNYEEILHENKIDYKVNIRDTASLLSDRDSVEKIFFNLVSNAFKYTPKNGYIYLDVWQDKDAGNELHLSIRNSGNGLTEQQMQEIFDKYKIFDTPKTKGTISTGIGLNLTKNLVELLGGSIEVFSEYGSYVEFKVTIPPLQPDNINIVTEKKETVEEPADQYIIRTETDRMINILIVDDEKNIRELLKDILSAYYHIIEAEDGKEALEIIGKNHPDIIITDMLMPHLGGLEMIEILKSSPKTSYIPIISISAKNSVEDQIDAYKYGADLYITKPFHPKHIISTIEHLISKQNILKQYFNSNISSIKVKDGIEIHQDDNKLIEEITEYVKNNIEDETLNSLSIAEFLNMSKATLHRKLKDITDKTPSEFVRAIRLEYAAKLLKTTKLTVLEVMYKSGFSNKSYFYREFQKQYQTSPNDFRKGG